MRMTAAALMVLVVAACTDTSTGSSSPPAPPTPLSPASAPTGASPLAAPRGMRWVGVNDVVVAVPRRWDTVSEPCARPDGDTVVFLGASSLVVRCATVPTRGVSSLTVTGSYHGVPAVGRRVDIGADLNGVHLLHSPVTCRAGSSRECTLALVVPGSDARFEVRVTGPKARAMVERIRDSVTHLPAGLTTVPLVEYGMSVDKAKEQLADAGLVGWSPDVNFPHYATGTNPSPGTVVEVGTEVQLTIGDG
jgi:hypothetical protein